MILLTQTELLAQGEDDYMSEEQVAFFKQCLQDKASAIQSRIAGSQGACEVERHADEGDSASVEEARTLTIRLIERDRADLVRIQHALDAIAEGGYGFCADTGEPIGIQRLLIVPESLYSVETMRIREAKGQHLIKVA